MTSNPALELFVQILNRVSILYLGAPALAGRDVRRASSEAHRAVIRAVVAGDTDLARRRMRRHLDAEAEFLRSRRPSRQLLGPTLRDAIPPRTKRAEGIARDVFVDVVEEGWPVGQLLGSEPELIEQHDASRAVLREAVRLLEYHHIAVMRRGPGGGLFVAEPNQNAIVEAVTVYLEQRGIEPAQLSEVRMGVELASLDLAISRLDADSTDRLRAVLEAEQSAELAAFPEVGRDLHVAIADVTGNRVLALMTAVLLRLSARHREALPGAQAPEISDSIVRAHRAIVDAMVSGDRDLARFRMRRHLAAMVPWLR